MVNERTEDSGLMTSLIKIIVCASVFSTAALAQVEDMNELVSKGVTPIRTVTSHNFSESKISASFAEKKSQFLCKGLESFFAKYGWEQDPCGSVKWQAQLQSMNSNALIYATFGSTGPTTLVMSAVHPDEMTPVPMGFKLAKYLTEHPEVYEGKFRIIVAPLVNPDGFIRNVPARTNSNGIDPNRNFLTFDWYADSKRFWQNHKQRRFRHFPGYFPNTEIETIFQMQLIETFRPDKIVSVHAPLGFLDYDGPPPEKPAEHNFIEDHAKKLVQEMSQKAKNYRIVDYSIYPGSLGNFAGAERNILTVTLELATTQPDKVEEYWQQFLPGLLHAAEYKVSTPQLKGSGNASNFITSLFDSSSKSGFN